MHSVMVALRLSCENAGANSPPSALGLPCDAWSAAKSRAAAMRAPSGSIAKNVRSSSSRARPEATEAMFCTLPAYFMGMSGMGSVQ